jgi:hypothetical protein
VSTCKRLRRRGYSPAGVCAGDPLHVVSRVVRENMFSETGPSRDAFEDWGWWRCKRLNRRLYETLQEPPQRRSWLYRFFFEP